MHNIYVSCTPQYHQRAVSLRPQRLARIAAAPRDSTLQVSAQEREAHQALLQGGMGLTPGEPPLLGATRLIQRAATARDVPNDHVIAAMATMELDQSANVPLEQLEGTWRLIFSSSSSLAAFQVWMSINKGYLGVCTTSCKATLFFSSFVFPVGLSICVQQQTIH